MPKKKYEKETEIKGEIVFQDVDPYHARFEMGDNKNLLGARRIQCPVSVLPADFESARYEVTGEYVLTIRVKEK